GCLREYRHQLLLVRGEHARGWIAFVWLHGCGVSMADRLRDQPGRYHWHWHASVAPLEELQKSSTARRSRSRSWESGISTSHVMNPEKKTEKVKSEVPPQDTSEA